MPEIKHDFSAGKMNKDLDERIVPNGEYRDAMNAQIRTTDSEGGVGNAGTVQNIKGNKQITENAHYEKGYLNSGGESKIIASIANEKNNKAYFFLSSPQWPFIGKFATSILNAVKTSTERKKYIDTIIEVNTGSGVTQPTTVPVTIDYWGFVDLASRVLVQNNNIGENQTWQSFNVETSNDYRVGMIVTAYDEDGFTKFTGEIQEVLTVAAPEAGEGYQIVLNESQESLNWNDVSFFTFRHPKRVLNLTNETKITGINIIDDLLFWTDNKTEPKKINITRSKAGSIAGDNLAISDWTRHTRLKLRDPIEEDILLDFTNDLEISQTPAANNDLKEEHITVIRKAPLMAPTLKMSSTDRASQITTVQDFFYNFANENSGQGPNPGDQIIIPSTSNNPNIVNALNGVDWREGDVIKFVNSQSGEWITASVTGINEIDCSSIVDDVDGDGIVNSEDDDCNDGEVFLDVNILTVSTPTLELVYLNPETGLPLSDGGPGWWNIVLTQRKPLFELKLGRFGCRYKYEDGEYSSFGPWSELAFLPGPFDYDHRKGYNLGMTNTVRELVIGDFIPHQRSKPNDVVAVDILYKTTDSPSVYVVKTIRRGVDDEWKLFTTSSPEATSTDFMFGQLSITSEMIHKVLPANQLLRAWDNVPKKVLSQEIAANRLVYGNYEQGYDLKNQLGLVQTLLSDNTPTTLLPKKSIKSIRDYKFGLVFGDKYGRETPVIAPTHLIENDNGVQTIIDGSVSVDKRFASSHNYFRLSQDWTNETQGPDDWISYIKYYIKETSNEYYNLVMDKWYPAEDGNIWLSFNSADRNKVDEDTYLILKNEHGNNNAVIEKARYKIIAIENEAPEFIKQDPRPFGEVHLGPDPWDDDDNTANYSFVYMFNPPLTEDMASMTKPFKLMEETKMRSYFADYDDIFQDVKLSNLKGELQTRVIGRLGGGDDAQELFSNQWEVVTAVQHKEQIYSNSGNGTGNFYCEFRWANPFGDQADMYTRFSGLIESDYVPDLRYYMEFREMIVKDKPEFDGKFFVKIERDDILDSKVLKQGGGLSVYDTTQSVLLAYIDNQQYNPGTVEEGYNDDTYAPRRNYKWLNGGADGATTGHTGDLVSAGTPGNNGDASVVSGITGLWTGDDECLCSYKEYDANNASGTNYDGTNEDYSFGNGATVVYNSDSGSFAAAHGSGCFSYDAKYLGLGCCDYDGIGGGPIPFEEVMGYGNPNFGGEGWLTEPYGDHGGVNAPTNIINRARETFRFWQWFAEESSPDLQVTAFIDGARSVYTQMTQQGEVDDWICDDGFDSQGNCLGPATASYGEGPTGKYTGHYYKATGIDKGVLFKGDQEDPTQMEYGPTLEDNLGRIFISVLSQSGAANGSGNPDNMIFGDNIFTWGFGEPGDAMYELRDALTTPGTKFKFNNDPTPNDLEEGSTGQIYEIIGNPNGDDADYAIMYNYNEIPSESWETTPNTNNIISGNEFVGAYGPYTVGIAGNCSNYQTPFDINYSQYTGVPSGDEVGVDYGISPYSDSDTGAANFPHQWLNPGCPYVGRIEEWNFLNFSNQNGIHHNSEAVSQQAVYTGLDVDGNGVVGASSISVLGFEDGFVGVDFGDPNDGDDSFVPDVSNSLIRVGGLYGHMYLNFFQPMDSNGDTEPSSAVWDHRICRKCSTMYGGNGSFGSWEWTAGPGVDFANFQWQLDYFDGNPFGGMLSFGELWGDIQDAGLNQAPKYCQRQGFRTEFRKVDQLNDKLAGEGLLKGRYGIDINEWDPRGSICHDGREALRLHIIKTSISTIDATIPVSHAAIWETEPKENVGLDIYYEASNAIPVRLNSENTSNFAPYNSKVTVKQFNDPSYIPITLSNENHYVCHLGYTQTHSIVGIKAIDTTSDPNAENTTYGQHVLQAVDISIDDYIVFTHPDGTNTMSKVISHAKPVDSNGNDLDPLSDVSNTEENLFQESDTATGYYKLNSDVWKFPVELGWHNCWSFGNGVESDRVRDDYNAPQIDNGVKVSTTFLDYGKERRGSGMIYSGLYNSTSGVNDLNEFNMAEKITKDINPSYGSIQALKTRDTDVVVLTEDKVLKVVTNKDALYNADGNPQLMASNRVLGTAVPFVGDYGISNNPESLAWDQFRLYFTDMQRGSVLRLSRDGLTPISDIGMKTWFRDNLKKTNSLLGTFDVVNGEYNLTLEGNLKPTTVSYNERSKGWVSFKSFIPQQGVSIGGKYITAISQNIGDNGEDGEEKKGIFEHYIDIIKSDENATNFGEVINRNVFYATNDTIQCEDSNSGNCEDTPKVARYFENTSLSVMFNDMPSSVKSFKAVNYEGSQGRVSRFTNTNSQQVAPDGSSFSGINDGEYYNLNDKNGWFISNITTDLYNEGVIKEFMGKEGKWFNRVSGLFSIIDSDQDLNEFSTQGLGTASSIIDSTPPEQVVININSDMIDDTSNPFDPLAYNNQ